MTSLAPIRKSDRPRSTSRVKVLNEERGIADPDRRRALATIAGQSVAVPAACVMAWNLAGGPGAAQASGGSEGAAPRSNGQTLGHRRSGPSRPGQSPIIRDFADPVVELHRLLREASEVEHALMVQYLYAAFSLKPAYQELVGFGDPNAADLLGVAIQEMQHLAQVNQMLVALGAAPALLRQDFPYEPDIYPFAFNLEPLSRQSLAKYVYTEAPAAALDRASVAIPSDGAFLDQLDEALGSNVRPNHIGSLYATIIAVCEEVVKSGADTLPDLRPWIETLETIKLEGEEDHFAFFKSVFMGSHKVLNGRPDVWRLPPDDPAYPSRRLPVNPSAYVGHENQIGDPHALSVAWLGNLHYWSILLLLDIGYRVPAPGCVELARSHMMGPFWSVIRFLPDLGAGMPFDPLSLGYSPCLQAADNLRFSKRILREAEVLEAELADRLPADFPSGICRDSLDALDRMQASGAVACR